jgi:hypothetical protein
LNVLNLSLSLHSLNQEFPAAIHKARDLFGFEYFLTEKAELLFELFQSVELLGFLVKTKGQDSA